MYLWMRWQSWDVNTVLRQLSQQKQGENLGTKIRLSPVVWFDASLTETLNPHIRLAWKGEYRSEGPPSMAETFPALWSPWGCLGNYGFVVISVSSVWVFFFFFFWLLQNPETYQVFFLSVGFSRRWEQGQLGPSNYETSADWRTF